MTPHEEAPAEPEPEPAGDYLIPRSRHGQRPKVLMCVTLGLAGNEFARVVAIIDEQRLPDLEPLIVTDNADFDGLRARRLLFEYFPNTETQARFGAEASWATYRVRRLTRLRQKWAPVRMIAFGAQAQFYLNQLANSPFENPSVLQVIGGVQQSKL